MTLPMTLATRCPACGTVFRMVQDQLRVSDGWVRCGRCAEVFNAVDHFVDAATAGLGTPAAGEMPGGAPGRTLGGERSAAADAAPEDGRRPGEADPPVPAETDTDLVPTFFIDADPAAPLPERGRGPATASATPVPPPGSGPVAPAPATDTDALRDPWDRRRVDTAEDRSAGADADALEDGPQDARAAAPARAPADDLAADPADRFVAVSPAAAVRAGAPVAALRMPAQPPPSFLRRADRAAHWRQPRVRAALAAGCVLAALLLLAQAAHTWRDLLAARWPALQPPLAQGCALLGCTLQPPRRIDAWVVDSSALRRVDRAPGAGLYRLSVSLHHRAAHTLALPALDLTLTDTQGRVIARRVLQPGDLADAPHALAAGTEWTAQATLQAEGGAVAGYTIELFYP
jgi:predicted Zn finger-like uncharacterized protein